MQLRLDHPHHTLFKDVCVAPTLSLAEVIVPGYVRNDLYITLQSAEISKGSKMSDKNVEVTVRAYDSEGNQLKVKLSHIFEQCMSSHSRQRGFPSGF